MKNFGKKIERFLAPLKDWESSKNTVRHKLISFLQIKKKFGFGRISASGLSLV